MSQIMDHDKSFNLAKPRIYGLRAPEERVSYRQTQPFAMVRSPPPLPHAVSCPSNACRQLFARNFRPRSHRFCMLHLSHIIC